jgi:hypothetical protein
MATISYDEFGRRFIEQVITADRVEATLEGVVAGSFDTEVKLAGGLVRARGSGTASGIEVDQVDSDALAFRALLHVTLSLVLKISGVPYRYDGRGEIVLQLHAVAQDDLSIFVEVPDVTTADVSLDLQPVGRVAAILDQLGGVNDQVRREIARFVNARKEEPGALEQRRIDVAKTIEDEWARRTQ